MDAKTNDNNIEDNTKKGQRFDVKRSLDENGSDDAPKCKVYKMLEYTSSDTSLEHIQLHNDLLDEQFVNEFTKKWSENESFNSLSSVELSTKPFQLCTVESFLQNIDHIPKLLNEMLDCEWTNKQMDLYEFHQTVDLNTATSKYLKRFYTFLNKAVLPWIQKLSGLNLTHVSASCSMYNAGGHLLVHDDLLGDRKIAYVFYLSPWTDWTESMGGALELFTCNEHIQPVHPPVRKIFPKNNQFVFFKVSEKSFHQVGEVTSYDYPRITINGWFHGPSKENQSLSRVRSKSPEYVMEYLPPTIDGDIGLNWINDIYLQANCKRNIQKHIEDKSEISLESFLKADNYRIILQHLIEIDETQWIHQGPAHYRNYDKISMDNVNGPIKDFYGVLRSNKWFSLMFDYTELDLYGKNARSPSVSIEFYRLTHGCYSLLNDRSGFFTDDSLDVILYFNSNPNFGFITYINPDEDDGNNVDDDSDEDGDDPDEVGYSYSEMSTICTNSVLCLLAIRFLIDNHRIWASLSFIFVIIFFGVPMWWKTTEEYRVSLPFSGIKQLADDPIKVIRNIGVYTKDPERAKLLIEELGKLFIDETSEMNFFEISFPKKLVEDSKSIASLEENVMNRSGLSNGERALIEWDHIQGDVAIRSNRFAVFSKDSTSIALERAIRQWMFKTTVDNNIDPYPQYDVLISILNRRPDIQNVQWNVRAAIESYLQPFVDTLSALSNFTIKSQWKYQVAFEFPSNQKRDNSTLGRHYSLSSRYLPHIITSIEKRLGNSIHDNPCIHLWGGIIIANPKENDCAKFFENGDQKLDIDIDMDEVVPILLHQLKKLIGVESKIPSGANHQTESLHNVEVERYFTYGTIFLLNKATATLQSLIQLLDSINNIVINDEVGVAVNEAYQHIIDSKRYLKVNDILNATEHAKKAFIQSERAFYYPSMLALLYFPDDQKYAIYIPLFLPIMIPVALSIKTIWLFFFKGNKSKPKTE